MSKKREYDEEYKVQEVKFAKHWISKSSSRGAANPCQHAVRLDTKSKNSRAGHRMRRTQPGRSIEHCQRESAAEKADQGIGKRKGKRKSSSE